MNECFFRNGAPASGPGANLSVHGLSGRRPALRLRPRLALGICAMFLALLVDRAPAQTNTPRPPSANRWLIVVETSKTMLHRGDGLQRIVGTLVASGMNGQMRPGDTLGVWTFNDELHAGEFALQTWAPANRQQISRRVVSFLQNQKFEKGGHIEKVIPALGPVLKNSDFLTIVLVSTGEQPIRGTPFDDAINQSYSTWRKEQEQGQMPFLTFLRGEGGRITAQWINTPPWPLEMRPLPAERRDIPTTTATKAPTPAPTPLIFSGRDPVPSTQEVSRPIPANVPPAATTTNAATSETDLLLPIPTASISGTGALAEVRSAGPVVPPPTSETVASKETPVAKSNRPVEVSPALVAAVERAAAPDPAPSPSSRRPVALETAAGPNENFLQRWAMWIAALASGLVLFLLGLVWSRRSRERLHVKLVSREKK